VSYPLLKVQPPAEHQQITLDTKTFDRYVGQYRLAPNAVMTISPDANRFYGQLNPKGRRNNFLLFNGSDGYSKPIRAAGRSGTTSSRRRLADGRRNPSLQTLASAMACWQVPA